MRIKKMAIAIATMRAAATMPPTAPPDRPFEAEAAAVSLSFAPAAISDEVVEAEDWVWEVELGDGVGVGVGVGVADGVVTGRELKEVAVLLKGKALLMLLLVAIEDDVGLAEVEAGVEIGFTGMEVTRTGIRMV